MRKGPQRRQRRQFVQIAEIDHRKRRNGALNLNSGVRFLWWVRGSDLYIDSSAREVDVIDFVWSDGLVLGIYAVVIIVIAARSFKHRLD